MMALVNISLRLEYGRPTAVLRRIAGIETRTSGGLGMSPTLPSGAVAGRMNVTMAKRLDDDAAAAGEPPLSPAPREPELPTALSLAKQLTFVMLSHTLRHPFHRPSEYATPTFNPYNTIILSFLATVVPWLRRLSVQCPGKSSLCPSPTSPAATSSATTRRSARSAIRSS